MAGGYGALTYKGLTTPAHRWIWLETYGFIPEGKQINHHCDVRSCYNVEHLYCGTAADNMRDRELRGRYKSPKLNNTHCPYGHPFSGDNLYMHPDGQRVCRTCRLEAQRKYRANNLEKRRKDDRERKARKRANARKNL